MGRTARFPPLIETSSYATIHHVLHVSQVKKADHVFHVSQLRKAVGDTQLFRVGKWGKWDNLTWPGPLGG